MQYPSYKVSGHDLYIVDGKAVVPYGTLVIQETKAPAGYEVSDDTWLVTFTEGSDGNVVRTWYDGKGNKLGTAAGVSVGNTRDPGTAAILEPVENPTLKTTALDKTTGLHEGNYQGDKTVVKDTVSIGKIVKGQTYTVRGTLMDKDTGKALKDVNDINLTYITYSADPSGSPYLQVLESAHLPP